MNSRKRDFRHIAALLRRRHGKVHAPQKTVDRVVGKALKAVEKMGEEFV